MTALYEPRDIAHIGQLIADYPLGCDYTAVEQRLERRGDVLRASLAQLALERGQPLLELRADERNLGQCEGPQKFRLSSRRNDVDAAGATRRLRALHSELRYELVGSAADGDRESCLLAHCVPHPVRGDRQVLVVVHALCPAHVEIPLVDARSLDDWREPLEHRRGN